MRGQAGKTVNEIVDRHFPKLKRYGCAVEPRTVYFRDFRPIEFQYRFGKANGCRVWVAKLTPDSLPFFQRAS